MTRLAIDMSSYIKTSLLAGKDEKDGITVMFEDKQVLVNSAEYGYENLTNMMLHTLRETGMQPKNCLLVFEGLQSKSKRLLIDPLYKSKRDKRPPEFYEQFQRLREFVESQWLGLGAISLCQDYAEGDDTLAYLAENLEEDLVIASRDGDLGTLNGVNAYGAKIETYNDGLRGIAKVDGEPWAHPEKYITLYKALVGDSSDSVPGVKGFGKAAFQRLVEQYGYDGLDQLVGMLEAGSLGPVHGMVDDDPKTHSGLKKIIELEADAIRCWKLVKMYPSWVNTMKHPLRIQAGKVTSAPVDIDERLKDFYSQEWLVTAENYDESKAFFEQYMAASDEVTFDIETSTPDESDEWLAPQPKGKGGGDKVDMFGSVLTGYSFTFGANNEFTFYLSVDHADTDNVPMSKAREMIEVAIKAGKKIVIHNTYFELTVLAQATDEDGTLWVDLWKDLGARGFIPNVLDTKLEASYVNENISTGLKLRSKHHLGYEQTSYQETMQMEGLVGQLPEGGRQVSVETREGLDGTFEWETRQYKMREVRASHVVAYGCDDTICTAALHNYFHLVMQLEHTYQVYLDVEIGAAYQHVKNFLDGMPFSLEKMRELEKIDNETWDRAWGTVRAYLMKSGWEGTVPPVFETNLTPAQIKTAYKIVVLGGEKGGLEVEDGFDATDDEEAVAAVVPGEEGAEPQEEKDAFLSSKVRTPAKLVALLRSMGHEVFASMVEECLNGGHARFTKWVHEHFTGEPVLKLGPHQLGKLLYDVMQLPVRVRGKATEIMKAKGILEGNPKANALAMEYALRDADDEQKAVIESLKLLTMVKTRRSLYYSKYPLFVHWKDQRIHSSHNQCQTNTRRASSAGPNMQQMPKHAKITGEPARFRETIVPHHKDAVIVSLDFDSQELRVIADYSKDENMVACYVGDNKKDMHALTGHSILAKRKLANGMFYEDFAKAAKLEDHPLFKLCKEYRALGKKVNFTTEFGAMAPKLAETMLCTEEEAQTYIDAKEAMFPGVRVWKDETIAESKRLGYVTTKLGARRHLRDVYMSDDHWLKSKAERQSVNFKVQSSSAEMTKKAEGRMWETGLVYKYDCICLGPIHDEVVFSVHKDQLEQFLVDAHWCMTQPYADMEIPIESSMSFGPSFGEQFEIGIKPTAQAVAEGWRQMKEAMARASKQRSKEVA